MSTKVNLFAGLEKLLKTSLEADTITIADIEDMEPKNEPVVQEEKPVGAEDPTTGTIGEKTTEEVTSTPTEEVKSPPTADPETKEVVDVSENAAEEIEDVKEGLAKLIHIRDTLKGQPTFDPALHALVNADNHLSKIMGFKNVPLTKEMFMEGFGKIIENAKTKYNFKR